MMGLVAPMAATAIVLTSPAKLPTIAMSDALKSCSSTPVAATGRAYRIILFQTGPLSISILEQEDFCISVVSKSITIHLCI